MYAFPLAPTHVTCQTHPILLDFVILIVIAGRNYEVPHYVILPSLLLLCPSVEIVSSKPGIQTTFFIG
jgi:hypothetical protein